MADKYFTVDFADLTDVYSKVEEESSRLKITDIVAEFILGADPHLMSTVLLFLRGTPFPPWSSKEIGIADKLMVKALSNVSGVGEAGIEDMLAETGDIGLVAEKALVNKPQTTLLSQTLTVEKVAENLDRLASLTGKGSQDRKMAYLTEMLSNASAKDSRYVVRLVLGQLRIGVGDGIIRDAIAKAYGVDASLVERAYNLRPDWGQVEEAARASGEDGLKIHGIVLGKPVKVMLAQKAKGLAQALEDLGLVQLEVKYDGARLQVHKMGDTVRLFTRRLEDVSKQFPEVVGWCRQRIKAQSALIEGEVVAVDLESGKPLPFQNLSRRIKRKYGIGEIVEKIPVEVNLFDALYLDGEELLDLEFSERRKLLSEKIEPSERFRLAEALITSDLGEADGFYRKALKMGHEGVMVKVLSSPYQPGNRVGYMYKVKPVMESLDLVVTGGTWGEGRRASWIGSYLLSVYDAEAGGFLEIGRMATGLTDEQLKELTALFKPIITEQKGRELRFTPQYVFEVAYEEIQRSPNYGSGYALRFPRLVRVREDKGVDEADTLDRVEALIRR